MLSIFFKIYKSFKKNYDRIIYFISKKKLTRQSFSRLSCESLILSCTKRLYIILLFIFILDIFFLNKWDVF